MTISQGFELIRDDKIIELNLIYPTRQDKENEIVL